DEGARRLTGPARRQPPRPQVAVAVLLERHPSRLGAATEPLPQRQVGIRPGEPPVAPGVRVLADVEDGSPHRFERGHSLSCIGIRTPRAAATSAAYSYPASVCRMTPMPGSLVSTRS